MDSGQIYRAAFQGDADDPRARTEVSSDAATRLGRMAYESSEIGVSGVSAGSMFLIPRDQGDLFRGKLVFRNAPVQPF